MSHDSRADRADTTARPLTDAERAHARRPVCIGRGGHCGQPARLRAHGYLCDTCSPPSHIRTRPAQGGTS